MQHFMKAGYWLEMRQESLHYTGSIFFSGLALIFLALIVFFWINKKRKNNGHYFRIWRRLNSFGTANLIIAFFLWFFAYEGIYIFSSRLWLIVWFIIMGIWLYFIYKDWKRVPELIRQKEKEMEYKKYIP